MTKARNSRRCGEYGNAFFMIMIGVVLFAALMFTFSRSARQGGENMSEKQREIAVTGVLSYAQKLERGVNRVMSGGRYSESYIDFDNNYVAGYANGDCGAEVKCKIFNASGGAVSWQNPPEGFNDGSDWIIAGTNAVPDVGDDTAADLVLLLSGLSAAMCTAVNNEAGISGSIPSDADDIDTTKFAGTFANTERIGTNASLSRKRAGCFLNTAPNPDEYVFYYVLWER